MLALPLAFGAHCRGCRALGRGVLAGLVHRSDRGGLALAFASFGLGVELGVSYTGQVAGHVLVNDAVLQ